MKTCAHLLPLELAIGAAGLKLSEAGESPYGPDWGLWSEVGCVLDESALRARLALPKSVTYADYDGRVAGSDATFYCAECKRAIMGLHPRYARDNAPRLV